MFMNRREIDEIFFNQGPILKHNLHAEILGDPPPPKGDPVFELKPLPDNLKYAYLDGKKIYPVIISANLSEREEERLLKTLKSTELLLDILWMISRALVPHYANTKLQWKKMPNQLEILNDD